MLNVSTIEPEIYIQGLRISESEKIGRKDEDDGKFVLGPPVRMEKTSLRCKATATLWFM